MRILASLAAGLVMATAWMMPALADCKSEVTTMGAPAGPGQSDAERVARVYWRGAVAQTYGSEYADWDAAQNASMECIQQSEDTYLCWATATPCSKEQRLLFE
jgi:hypothetical protein